MPQQNQEDSFGEVQDFNLKGDIAFSPTALKLKIDFMCLFLLIVSVADKHDV